MAIWTLVVGILIAGYLTFARSFAYLGVPPIFIGEVTLASLLLLKPRVILGTWISSLLRPSPLNGLGLTLLVFMIYGVWQVVRGVMGGSPVIHTLKSFVFNYYALYIFMGLWVGLHVPHLLPKLVRILGWVNGIYGLLYLAALRHVDLFIPGYGALDVPLFSAPTGQVPIILGLLCLERDLRSVWLILLINVMVTLGYQVRAEWVGLALGLLTWGIMTGRLGRLVAMGLAGVCILGLIEFAEINIPGRGGGSISLSENLSRAIAPFNVELAEELNPDARIHSGTSEWRLIWWEAIWRSVHSSLELEAFGHGYGFPLIGVAPEEAQKNNETTRTPHSTFFFLLGYTGWVGVILFSLFHFTILRLLWQAFRLHGQTAGIVWWVMAIAMSMFQEGLETPFHAIPFYLMAGLTMAPALQGKTRSDAPAIGTQVIAATGR